MKAAIFIEGTVVTGENHGIAFGKLSAEQQMAAQMASGFFDPETKKFIDPDHDQTTWMKKIILIRHAHVQNQHVTEIGRQQAHATADFLFNSFDLGNFEFIASPIARCVETLQQISKEVSSDFCTDKRFTEMQEGEPLGEFLGRLQECVDELPDRTLVCTHCDCILNLLSFSLLEELATLTIPYCSSSYIDNGVVLWVGKTHDTEEELPDENSL